MPVSIDWGTKTVHVPQSFMTYQHETLYLLDVEALRDEINMLEDDEEGMAFPDVINHNAPVTLAGVTYARFIEFINGYQVEFENAAYQVQASGANHNLSDVMVHNNVSLITSNSAGLVQISDASCLLDTVIEGGYTMAEVMRILARIAAGKTSGAGSGTHVFRDLDDTKDAIVGTVDGSGNRTAVTIDET